MRIGLIRMRHTPYGGAEVFMGRFVDELLRLGHTVDIFAADWPEKKGIAVHRVKTWGPSFLRPRIFAANAAKAVERVRPDVVISLERTACQDIYRAGDGVHREWLLQREKAAQGLNPFKGLKGFFINLNPLHAVLLNLEKRLFSDKRLRKVVANSNRVKQEIIRHYGLPEEKICVIYNGINAAEFAGRVAAADRAGVRKELAVSGDECLLLFVGSGFERKGLIYLIRALGPLADVGKKPRLVVVGKGNPARYRKEAERLGVADRVIFKGAVRDAARFYAAADVFVLPSIYEPFSNACLEAMAVGLPVVTSRMNGASEIITEPVNGAVIEDPTDHLEIAKKIALFLDTQKRRLSGEAARRTAFEYSIEKNVSEFLKLIV